MTVKIKFHAVGREAPDYYEIDGEIITAFYEDAYEEYDLSDFPEGGEFQSASLVGKAVAIRDVERVNGELRVTLCQQVGPGDWSESGWFDAVNYDPEAIHVKYKKEKPHSGTPLAKTKKGKEYV